MHSCPAYPYRSSYAVSGSPLRGYHSLARHDDNVFPSLSSARSSSSRCRRLSSAAGDCRPKSNGSDGRKSPSFGSGSPDGASHMDCSLEYLADLVKEKKDLEMFGDNFQHVDRLLSEGTFERCKRGVSRKNSFAKKDHFAIKYKMTMPTERFCRN
ncbi:hypothetical protein OESDEN_12593 [Oesophagostomum dentatum]|uniref:STAR protein homodimerisation region domain-containing protein n=1 Tax=Oesophagostomum dentatum TaxID=61180 RepID=A0A0B1SWW8_OESDE|nr:hypothetical protein OESDEN_12593 [Oesophagostomum dentatum]